MPPEELLPVADALARILAHFDTLPTEPVATAASLGRVLGTDVRAQHDVPPFANSAMDGYAVRAADIADATPDHAVELRVIEDIRAGISPQHVVTAGTASRIMTGAPLPEGADAVVPVEDSSEEWQQAGRDQLPTPKSVQIYASARPNRHVRPAGQDIAAGDIALRAGTVIRPQEIGVLATLGVSQVDVVQRPTVAVLSTGDELLPIDAPIAPGKIRDANGYTLTNLVKDFGGIPLWLGIAGDDAESVRSRLVRAADEGAHLILSSAGVSVGAYDVVRDVLAELGEVDFWRVRMRPGKPLAFGLVSGVPFYGLPGNPVSAMVSFDVFVRPAILKLGGRNWQVQTVPVTLGESLRSDGRESYLRVEVGEQSGQLVAHSVGSQGSNLLTSLVRANALLILPEGLTDAKAGEVFQARLFDQQYPFPHRPDTDKQEQ